MSFAAGLGTMRELYGSITCADGWDLVANSTAVRYRLVFRRFYRDCFRPTPPIVTAYSPRDSGVMARSGYFYHSLLNKVTSIS